jgi:hypothetical protein
MTNSIQDAAADFLEHGLRPIRIVPLGKKPIAKEWQHSSPQAHEFLASENIGIDLSRSADLIDIDLDIPAARALAALPCFFGDLPSFGREGDLPGHRLVRSSSDGKVKRFGFSKTREKAVAAALPKSMVLELRTGRAFTVFPPSRYENGSSIQRVVWTDGEFPAEIPEMAWETLTLRAGLLAFCAAIATMYPAQGSRDQVCMHIAGALVHAGVDKSLADDLTAAIARFSGDEEWERRRGKAELAAEKISRGDAVTGLPTLLEELGLSPCEATLRSWLGSTSTPQTMPSDAKLIRVDNPAIHELAADFAGVLHAGGRVFRRQNELVRLCTLQEPENVNGIYRRWGCSVCSKGRDRPSSPCRASPACRER